MAGSEADDETLPLSRLQHLVFCPRQWALIRLEQVWVENLRTGEGRLLQEYADLPVESRWPGVRTTRGMWLRSERLRLAGRADIVKFRPGPYPVECKRGKSKPDDCGTVQLCSQVLCLKEMLGASVGRGAIFYGNPRPRLEVVFTAELRARTEPLAATMHRLCRDRVTPAATPGPYCKNGRWSMYVYPRRPPRTTVQHSGSPSSFVLCKGKSRFRRGAKAAQYAHVMMQGAYLHWDGETVAVKTGKEFKLRFPIHTLEGLVCWGGRPPVSRRLPGLSCERGADIPWSSRRRQPTCLHRDALPRKRQETRQRVWSGVGPQMWQHIFSLECDKLHAVAPIRGRGLKQV